jgi:hypothetical protein
MTPRLGAEAFRGLVLAARYPAGFGSSSQQSAHSPQITLPRVFFHRLSPGIPGLRRAPNAWPSGAAMSSEEIRSSPT